MEGYELMTILDGTLTDEEAGEVFETCRKIIGQGGGEIAFESSWGRRRLAYEMKKKQHGIYQLFYLCGKGNFIKEMLVQFGYNERILKAFVVKVEDLEAEYNEFEALKQNPQKTAMLITEE